MKKKKNIIDKNFLEKKPIPKIGIEWTKDESNIITLEIENKGFMNRIAQKIFKKPKTSYVHMDEMGSFIWPLLDGEKDILKLGEYVDEHFGEKAHPLYERLAKYFQILESYGFIEWNE